MVKKKSHEERHDEPMPEMEVNADQANAEAETATEIPQPGEPEATSEGTTGDDLLMKLTEMQDRYLRLSAEFDNYRKRTLREKIELAQSGGEGVIIKLLPIIDDFDRAIISMRITDDCNAIKKGLELIYNKINDFLKQNDVQEIAAVNEPFNSDLHEAVTSISVDNEALKGKVIEVTQKGYILKDKVIRYPKVVVGE
ncbi:MAG: nucleotide exchange factor GrpE [Bacteroidales bacterium]|jgi:molecular chaperone GrpE|nr:nucleotide exchange factor GrpE [Bacteroidales bacterium]